MVVNGKDLLLLRLRSGKRIKKFTFLESEITNEVIDLQSKKLDEYRSSELKFNFKTPSFQEVFSQISCGEQPKWLSKSTHNILSKIKNSHTLERKLNPIYRKYINRVNSLFNIFVSMSNQQTELIKEKGQNSLYLINYMISGQIQTNSKGNETTNLRFPFAFQKVEKININHTSPYVEIILSNEVYPNTQLLSYLGNSKNINTESGIKSVEGLTVKDDYISPFIKLYEKIGVKIDAASLSEIKCFPLKINWDNRSASNNFSCALHEARHLVVAKYLNANVVSADIYSSDYYGCDGKISIEDNEKNSFENEIVWLLAPYVNEELIDFDYVSKKAYRIFDFERIIDILDSQNYSEEQSKEIFNQCLAKSKEIVSQEETKINLYVKFLVKHKEMNVDEINEQWNNKELIPSYNKAVKECKFELNKFVPEKVNLLAFCPELTELDIYRETKEIFEKTTFAEDLLKISGTKLGDFIDESKVNWAYDCDFSQQKATLSTYTNDNIIIQGPPGTGKTQTILNIIGDCLAKKKKVLVVAEKTTALQVIKDRITKHSEDLMNLVLDLYNIDQLGIKFFTELSRKLHNLNNMTFEDVDLPNSINLQNKVNSINKVGYEIRNFNIPENADKVKLINPQDSEKLIVQNLKTTNLNELIKYNNKNILNEISQWLANKNELLDFKNQYFKSNISEEKIKALYELNTSIPYTIKSSFKFGSLFVRNKEKVNIFIRHKYRKIAIEQKFDSLFFNDFEKFKKYINFDFQKFNQDDINAMFDIQNLTNNDIDVERAIDIDFCIQTHKKFSKIKNKVETLDVLNFIDINNQDNFDLVYEYVMHMWQKEIYPNGQLHDRYLKYSHVIKYLEGLVDRIKMSKNTKNLFNDSDVKQLIFSLFPVILATPENVSKYIPFKKDMYDVVVIDEASQFLVEKSMPTLYRGKKRIISGDKQQLRPTYFNRYDECQNDETTVGINQQLVDSESILDLYNMLLNTSGVMLTTHYRSQKEELIKFSNKNFYDGKLSFIENASFINYPLAIEIIDVKGAWRDQRNIVEAEQIIDMLEDIYSENRNAKVGVIVFSKRQANLIKKQLFERRSSRIKNAIESYNSHEPETLFIKSIDDVQGEERDTIIFGITYGDKVLNYRLLSDTYAMNKINVAITRAKNKIIIVKSHKASDYRRIKNSVTGSKGPETLFNFLQYAEDLVAHKEETFSKTYKNINDKYLVEYFENNNIHICKTICINSKNFYIEKNNEGKYNIYYLIDDNSMENARENIWFFNSLFERKEYNPKPKLITEIINI